MPRQGPVQAALNSGPVLLTSFVVGVVVPAITFLSSKEVRDWIETNGRITFWVGLGLVLLLLGALDFQRRASPPDDRDVALMNKFRADLGGDATLTVWVREHFGPNRISRDNWMDLARTLDTWEQDPGRRFSDKKVHKKYQSMLSSLRTFMIRVDNDVYSAPGPAGTPPERDILGLPSDWKWQNDDSRVRYETAVVEIANLRSTYLSELKSFLELAHRRGL